MVIISFPDYFSSIQRRNKTNSMQFCLNCLFKIANYRLAEFVVRHSIQSYKKIKQIMIKVFGNFTSKTHDIKHSLLSTALFKGFSEISKKLALEFY